MSFLKKLALASLAVGSTLVVRNRMQAADAAGKGADDHKASAKRRRKGPRHAKAATAARRVTSSKRNVTKKRAKARA
jgi:hypothetical protein